MGHPPGDIPTSCRRLEWVQEVLAIPCSLPLVNRSGHESICTSKMTFPGRFCPLTIIEEPVKKQKTMKRHKKKQDFLRVGNACLLQRTFSIHLQCYEKPPRHSPQLLLCRKYALAAQRIGQKDLKNKCEWHNFKCVWRLRAKEVPTPKVRLHKSLWTGWNILPHARHAEKKNSVCLRQAESAFRNFIFVGCWWRAADWLAGLPKVTAQHRMPRRGRKNK